MWLKAQISGQYVYDEFITSIEVVSVKNSSGKNVFDTDTSSEPARLSFAVTFEMAEYLNLIELIPELNMEVFPVPRNSLYTEEGQEVAYANELLLEMIQSYAGFTVGQ